MKSLSVTAGPLARRVAVSSVVVEEVANLLNLLLAAESRCQTAKPRGCTVCNETKEKDQYNIDTGRNVHPAAQSTVRRNAPFVRTRRTDWAESGSVRNVNAKLR